MISVYKANINDFSSEEYNKEFLQLSLTEQNRINSLKKDYDRKRSLATKILLRRAVKENFSVDNFVFTRNTNQKPIADFGYISLSHSGDMAVCAVSNKPVGIDIEEIKPKTEKTSYHFFTKEENDYVNSTDSDITLSFLKVWTRKEAYFKCIDENFQKLSSVSVLTDFGDFSFKTEILDEYIISVCKRK